MNSKETSKKYRKNTFDVYIGHLPKVVHEDKLRQYFAKYGDIVDILCRHGNGSFGYAIVKFKYQKDADRVVQEINKIEVNGYEMEVRSGKKNNLSVENGDGVHTKTVSFCEPESNVVHFIDNDPQVRDGNYMASAQNGMNGHQSPVMIEIICTNVENAVTFYGYQPCRSDELNNLSIKLNSICPNLVRLGRKPMSRKVYGALFDDMRWYRCTVIQCTVASNSGKCIVEYIDYGNTAEVYYINMVDLPEPLKKMPPFAVKCVLSNLECNPKYHNEVSYLHHLVNKRMTLSAIISWGAPVYHVLKCSSNGIDVVSELVRNGFAVYKSQLTPSPLPHSSEKPGCLKIQENNKSKKNTSIKVNSKKVVFKESSNGVEKLHIEVMNGELDARNSKNCTSDNSQLTISQDFIPKRIIKRGSDIANTGATVPVLEGVKTVNDLLKVDCVLSNLTLVNNIRNLVSFPTKDNLMDSAADLLLTDVNDTLFEDKKNVLENAHKNYCEALNDIKDCHNQELLSDLKERRNLKKNQLLIELKQFLEGFDYSLLAKRKNIQELITALESNSNEWMNIYLSSLPGTVQDLLKEYNKGREHRWSVIQKARDNTNEKHKKFLEFLNDFKKGFSLNMLDGNSNDSYHENTEGTRGSYALKLEEALTDLGNALEEEVKTCSVTKDKGCFSVIKCILEKLDVPKERIDSECEFYKKYKSMYDDLNCSLDLNPLFDELSAARETIKSLPAECVNDEEKLLTKLDELHSALLQEDASLERLSKISSLHFPELVLDHPELNLQEYQNNWYLLKKSWSKTFFPDLQSCIRIEPSYISKFAKEPVVIKEFDVHSESERNSLVKKAIVWNEIKSKSLVKIKALFKKEGDGVYALFPNVWKTLQENPLPTPVDVKLACQILKQVLRGLFDIHERGMAHGTVHPLAILHKDGEVLLDFNYDRRFLDDKLSLKGINFQDPCGEDMYKSSDMYMFGCLVLWVLFPNLSFTSGDDGVPNFLAFQSIIQELLTSSDTTDLFNLLSANQFLRPTSKDLHKKGFLKNLRIIPKSMP